MRVRSRLFVFILLLFSARVLPAAPVVFVDPALTAPCQGTYSIKRHNCSGRDGNAHPSLQQALSSAKPGTTIHLRAGLYRESGYRSSIRGDMTARLENDGAPSQPIVIQPYRSEEVTLDGSDPINWQACSDDAACARFPNRQEVVEAPAPAGVSLAKLDLLQGRTFLYTSQDPEPADAFYPNQPDTWRLVPSEGFTLTTLRDPQFFTQQDPAFWVGAYVRIWTCNNNIIDKKIKSYDPAASQISFDAIPCEGWLDPGKDRYAVLNHPMLLDHPGEVYFDEEKNVIYARPYDRSNLSTLNLAVRSYGININGKDHYLIRGLRFQRYSVAAIGNYNFGDGYEASDLTVDAVTVKDGRGSGVSLSGIGAGSVLNSRFDHLSGNAVHMSGGTGNHISGNLAEFIGGTVLRMYGSKQSSISGNTIRHCRGQHANGITAYLQCEGVLIENNLVEDSNIPLTFQSSNDITVRRNVFVGPGFSVAGWASDFSPGVKPHTVRIYNNTFVDPVSWDNNIYVSGDFQDVEIYNNIVGRPLSAGGPHRHHHNLFFHLTSRRPEYDLAAFSESVERDPVKLFRNVPAGDYHLFNRLAGEPPVNPCRMSSGGAYVGAVACLPPAACTLSAESSCRRKIGAGKSVSCMLKAVIRTAKRPASRAIYRLERSSARRGPFTSVGRARRADRRGRGSMRVRSNKDAYYRISGTTVDCASNPVRVGVRRK